MTALCVQTYRFFRRHRAAYWLILVSLFCVLGFTASRIHLEEDINKLMPSSRNADGTEKLAFASLRIKDKTFICFHGHAGTTPERMAAVCDEFVDSLRTHVSGEHVLGDIFYRLDDNLVPDAIGYMTDHLPCYIDTAAYAAFDTLLTPEHVARQMAQNRKDLEGDFGQNFPELIQMDPLGLRGILAGQLGTLMGGADSKGGYRTIGGHFFVPDGTVCLAFLSPVYSATNTGKGSELFVKMNEEIDRFAKTCPDVEIAYSGTPASGFYNATQIKHDLVWTVGGALVVVLVFLLLCFRRWDTLPLLVLPVAFGTLFGLAVMQVLKGQFSLLALGIGAIVLGVAMSYVLHVLTHIRYVSDPEQMLREQTKPLCLGCLTTIGSFMGLIFINTELLQDFGLFAALAVVGTTAFCLLLLPQLLGKGAAPTSSAQRPAFPLVDRFNACPLDRCKPLVWGIVAVAVVLVGCYCWHGTQFDANMHNLGYDNPRVRNCETLLDEKTHTTEDKQKYFASSGRTMEEAIANFATLSAKLDSLKQLGLVKSYRRTDHIFVPLAEQQRRIDAWQRYWTPARQRLARQLIAAAAPKAGMEPEAFEPFFDAVLADYTPDPLYKADIIPAGYLSTMMERTYDGRQYLCFTQVRCPRDSDGVGTQGYVRVCDAIATQPNLLVLDTYYYTIGTLREMNSDFNVLQWVSMAFVFVVLLVSFRFNLRHTLLGFMPILVSWLIVLGAMALCDIKFNLINIIISTFIFGIGVDYSIFVMNGLVADAASKAKTSLLATHKTAIFFSAVILIVTVASMLFAKHPAIRSVGFSTLVGLASAVVICYVVQPAMFRWMNKESRK